MAILDIIKNLFNKNEECSELIEENLEDTVTYEIDEEDRIVVALAASIMASEDKPNSQFHIKKITRIK